MSATQLDSPSDPQAPHLSAQAFVTRLGAELSAGTLQLPSFPEALMRIQRVVADPKATARTVTDAVRGEPAFTARLVHMANSVMMKRGSEPLSNLTAIVNRVGFDTIRQLASVLAVRQLMFAKMFTGLAQELEAVWAHSLETAAIAFVLAQDVEGIAPEEALLTGMLHDVGVLHVLAQISEIPEMLADRETVDEIVRDWHPAVGRAILEHWEFPEALVMAVDEHETLERSHVGRPDLTDVIIVANVLARRRQPGEADLDLDEIPAVKHLGLTGDTARARIEAGADEIAAVKAALS